MNTRLTLLNQTTLESLAETERIDVVENFVKTGIKILGADFGFMFWRLEDQNTYQLFYKSPEVPYNPKLPTKDGYNDKASRNRIPYFVTKPRTDLLPYMKSLAIVPIFYKEHQYGNIVLCFRKPRVFTEDEESLITALGSATAQVLTILNQHKKAERDSQKLLKQKDEFFNIASHELKTPVTTIKGFAQILTERLEKSDKKTKYFLNKINNQVDKLGDLINDLLDVSRIEIGKLKLAKSNFELRSLIKEVVENLGVSLPNHKINFKSDCQFWILGDSERIERVVINLITNAVKYSPQGSKIKIYLKEKGGMAQVEVEDFGYGIKEKDRAKIFSRFFQSKNSSGKNLPGLGLGLYIASSIVKNHKGFLDFKSKKTSKGSVFYFSLPYYKYRKIS